MPNIQKVSSKLIAECTATEVAAALTRSFEGYILGPVDVDERAYERRFRAENLDPFASRVYFLEEWPVGVLLVARRGWTSRIAGMGIVPEARRKGLGLRVMHEAIKDAESRGDHSVVLEVFEQNLPAVELYAGLGFRKRRRLVGYGKERTKTSREKPQAALFELDPLEVARVVAREGETDLPWMLAAETLSAATPPTRAYHLDHQAYAVIADTEAEALVLTSFIVPRTERRKGWGTRLLRLLEEAFPARSWSIPAIVPEDLAPTFFASQGWAEHPLSQLEMRLDLSSAP